MLIWFHAQQHIRGKYIVLSKVAIMVDMEGGGYDLETFESIGKVQCPLCVFVTLATVE